MAAPHIKRSSLKKYRNRRLRTRFFGSIFLLLNMCWLTVCTPFVFDAEQRLNNAVAHQYEQQDNQENGSNQLNEDTDGSSSINTINEEFLHTPFDGLHTPLFLSRYAPHHADPYVAFHGELFCPPPNYC